MAGAVAFCGVLGIDEVVGQLLTFFYDSRDRELGDGSGLEVVVVDAEVDLTGTGGNGQGSDFALGTAGSVKAAITFLPGKNNGKASS